MIGEKIVMSKLDIAEAECPSCSPDEPTVHVILKEGGLVKCEGCGYVHAIHVPKKKVIRLRVIVSRHNVSSVQFIDVNEDDIIRVGDEFVVEHENDEVSGIQVQSVEIRTHGRPDNAVARDVETLWGRTIDEVIVKIAVQKGALTESVNYKVSGDFEFTVGNNLKLQSDEAVIISIKVRDGAHARRKGQVVKAKDIKRIFSRSLTSAFRYGGRTSGFSKPVEVRRKSAPTGGYKSAEPRQPGGRSGGARKPAEPRGTGGFRPRSTGTRRNTGGKR
jgi:uncharacterized Zn finger protein